MPGFSSSGDRRSLATAAAFAVAVAPVSPPRPRMARAMRAIRAAARIAAPNPSGWGRV